jgi:hypothetical protein
MAEEKTEEARATELMTKAELREGGSARARFYRKKDELLDFHMTQVAAFSRAEPRKFEPMMTLFVRVRSLKERLDRDTEDEAALSEAIEAMESLRKAVDESDLRSYPSNGIDPASS